MDLSFILNHLGEEREHYSNAVAPPLFQTSNFCFKTVGDMRERLKHEFEQPFYTRGYNPTVASLRKKIAALEGAEDALVFASGSAAVAAAVMSVVKNGDHAICVKKPYSWTNILHNQYLAKYGVSTTTVDGTSVANFEAAIQENTKLIFLESPNSITFEMQDIEAIANIAKKKNITTIIDNSYATPLNQSPIALGVDIVVHSASKYLGGHSDIVAGVLATSTERIKKIFAEEFMTLGGIISPHDAWLMLRGLRTLELRVERSSQSAAKVVSFLENHPAIEEVLYPFSPKNTQQALAKKQMKQGGGLLSILIKANTVEEVERCCNSLQCFLIACSWGSYESLIFPICALHNSKSYDNPLPWNLVRIYVGIENPDVLIADLKQALKKINS